MQISQGKPFDAGSFDVIIVGAGHAGSEAALAAARMGNKTLLLTISLEMVAFMPCNPSVGGPAKGIVVREIDALGGEMGRNIDKTYVQMRMLNTGKGPAVRALRAQADKHAYHRAMKQTMEETPNLTLRQATVDQLVVEDGVCKGVITNTGAAILPRPWYWQREPRPAARSIIGELMYESGPNIRSQPLSCLRIWKSWALTCSGLRPERHHASTAIRSTIRVTRSSQVTKNRIISVLIRRTVNTSQSLIRSPVG